MMRDLISHNFRWKAISLGLAIVVWFAIKFDAPTPRTHTAVVTVPIHALSDPSDKKVWRFNPPEATVRVRAPLGVEVDPEDIVAFVNLAGAAPSDLTQNLRIRVDVPAGVEVMRVDPPGVLAQYSTLPADGPTNKLGTP